MPETAAVSISGSLGPDRPLRSLGHLRVGVLPSDLLIIGVKRDSQHERGWWDEWLALVVRPNLGGLGVCNLRLSWLRLASKASKHGRFRTVAMFAHGTARDGNSVCSAYMRTRKHTICLSTKHKNSHLFIHSFFCSPPSRSKTRNHGRTHPPHQEDCRQEANQEVRPASVGPVHPHPQLLLEEAQGY